MRLLIADDDPSLRLALRLVFEDAGHDVLEAASEAEARVALDTTQVDVTLIDAGMSGRGVALWRELSGTAGFDVDRVLLLTGNLPALGSLAAHDRVLGKPFDYGALLARIEDLGPRH